LSPILQEIFLFLFGIAMSRRPSCITGAPKTSSFRYNFSNEDTAIKPVSVLHSVSNPSLQVAACTEHVPPAAFCCTHVPAACLDGDGDLDDLEQRLSATLTRLDANAELLRHRDGCDEADGERFKAWLKRIASRAASEAELLAQTAQAEANRLIAFVICASIVQEITTAGVDAAARQREESRQLQALLALEALNMQDAERRECRRREAQSSLRSKSEEAASVATYSSDPMLAAIRCAAAERRRAETEAAEEQDLAEMAALENRLKALTARKNAPRRR
jgi:hypothetical protein